MTGPIRPPLSDVELELPALHPSQQEIFDDPARFKVLACGRRWGKTTFGILLCLTIAVQGGRAWWVASTFDTAYEGWEPLKELAQDLPYAVVRESRRTIYFKVPGQRVGRIQVRSADRPEGLRGPGLDLAVLDEAAFCQERVWTHSLRPALSDRRGRALLISTPNGKNWFAKLWERGQTVAAADAWRSWTKPSWDNPILSPEEIEQAREDSHPDVFAQEWGAQFLDVAMLQPYRMEWLLDYDPTAIPVPADLYISLGIDPAISKKDTACQTAISVCGQALRGPLQSTALVLDHASGHWSPYETADRVFGFIKKFHPRIINIEDVAYQRALKDIIERESRDRGLPLPAINLVKPELDKLRRALSVSPIVESGRVLFNPLLVALKKNLVSLPDVKAAWDDADAFELAIKGLPIRHAERTKLERLGETTPAVARAQSYAANPLSPLAAYRARLTATTDPPPAGYLGRGVWRRPAPPAPRGVRVARTRAASYAGGGIPSPLDGSRLFPANFGRHA